MSLAGIWVPQRILHWFGPMAAGILTLALPVAYYVRFGADALSPAAIGVNLALTLAALALVALAVRNLNKTVILRMAAAPAAW